MSYATSITVTINCKTKKKNQTSIHSGMMFYCVVSFTFVSVLRVTYMESLSHGTANLNVVIKHLY